MKKAILPARIEEKTNTLQNVGDWLDSVETKQLFGSGSINKEIVIKKHAEYSFDAETQANYRKNLDNFFSYGRVKKLVEENVVDFDLLINEIDSSWYSLEKAKLEIDKLYFLSKEESAKKLFAEKIITASYLKPRIYQSLYHYRRAKTDIQRLYWMYHFEEVQVLLASDIIDADYLRRRLDWVFFDNKNYEAGIKKLYNLYCSAEGKSLIENKVKLLSCIKERIALLDELNERHLVYKKSLEESGYKKSRESRLKLGYEEKTSSKFYTHSIVNFNLLHTIYNLKETEFLLDAGILFLDYPEKMVKETGLETAKRNIQCVYELFSLESTKKLFALKVIDIRFFEKLSFNTDILKKKIKAVYNLCFSDEIQELLKNNKINFAIIESVVLYKSGDLTEARKYLNCLCKLLQITEVKKLINDQLIDVNYLDDLMHLYNPGKDYEVMFKEIEEYIRKLYGLYQMEETHTLIDANIIARDYPQKQLLWTDLDEIKLVLYSMHFLYNADQVKVLLAVGLIDAAYIQQQAYLYHPENVKDHLIQNVFNNPKHKERIASYSASEEKLFSTSFSENKNLFFQKDIVEEKNEEKNDFSVPVIRVV